MARLGAIEFDEYVLDALRDGTLVIFAGAGVSMGPPSCLASFWTLAEHVAQGSGLTPKNPLDRFLGQLQHSEVKVHERAAEKLAPEGSEPNDLHYDLLRLFRTAENVKLITTNFDLHFTTAAETLFDVAPVVYRAPALPLGYNFSGIVHVHGALPNAQELVLTDADFGRAYLTEGWARRFLLDVFRKYTVLFVGYSHDDIVMSYLARALPVDGVGRRFALTDKDDAQWDLLGITPIRFPHENYQELYSAVKKLAERTSRGILDEQARLAELGNRLPPEDEEAIGEVEQALREAHTLRFLLDVASDAEWPRWLNARKHLDRLFEVADLNEREHLLVRWLADRFAIQHPELMFDLLAKHNLNMNPRLWEAFGRTIGIQNDVPLDVRALQRWVTILLKTAPPTADSHILLWLAERCAENGLATLVLSVFLQMSVHRLVIKPRIVLDDDAHAGEKGLDAECPLRSDHWLLQELWTNCLKRHLSSIAKPLLSGVTKQLEDIHKDLGFWGRASSEWDPLSYGRSAIEPHGQDNFPKPTDVLIDAARDALEWLAANEQHALDAWVELLITSEAPLLRRLGVHALTVHPKKTANERLEWLIDRVGLYRDMEYHEVHRAVARNYAHANDRVRAAVVNAVLAHKSPAAGEWSSDQLTQLSHFEWLSWLTQSKPDCAFAQAALAPIKARYPEWKPQEYPDLTHWSGSTEWVGYQSPWPVEQLLTFKPKECLDELLAFQGNTFDGPDRHGLTKAVTEACQQSKDWAFALGDGLIARSAWSSDLWPAVFRGLQEAELTPDDWHTVLIFAARPELHTEQAYELADLLYSLVKDEGKPFALELLEDANPIVLSLWDSLKGKEEDKPPQDWLRLAINRPAGIIVKFWLNSLSLLLANKKGAERILPERYQQWFSMAVSDPSLKGALGRCMLASQTGFLFSLDEAWTRKTIIPLFTEADNSKFAQAWSGFLAWGHLYPALVDALMPAFISGLERIDNNQSDFRHRFMEYFTALAVLHISNPIEQLLPALFHHGKLEDRRIFASQIGFFLRQTKPKSKQELWERWLCQYWNNRLQGVFAKLDDSEIEIMLKWLPHLDEVYPQAVSLAIRAPAIPFKNSLMLHELNRTKLVTRYPEATAELLIYLSTCEIGYNAYDFRKVADRLTGLDEDLAYKLNEGLARLGV